MKNIVHSKACISDTWNITINQPNKEGVMIRESYDY